MALDKNVRVLYGLTAAFGVAAGLTAITTPSPFSVPLGYAIGLVIGYCGCKAYYGH